MPTLLREFEKLDGIAILATNRGCVIDEAMERRILCKFEFEIPTPELREQIWRNHLPPEAPVSGDIDFRQLAEEYDFSGGFIKNAVLVALQNALQREGEPRITHADLVCGSSGIGKTMTAKAVAYELGQVLFPVNLAGVIDKYVGQTEKNLASVFRAAREAGAVLFFDEADSLFVARIGGENSQAHYIRVRGHECFGGDFLVAFVLIESGFRSEYALFVRKTGEEQCERGKKATQMTQVHAL